MAKKYLIETYGCQMNVHDSERMAGLLEQACYEPARDDAEADVVVINTCSVREHAEDKLYTRLGELRVLAQEQGHNPIVAVAGCVAQAVPPVPPPGLPSSLLERRPDVRATEQSLVAANAQMNSNNNNAWRIATQFGTANQNNGDNRYNGKLWAILDVGMRMKATTLFVYAIYEQVFVDLRVGRASALTVIFLLLLVSLSAAQLWAFRARGGP